MSHSLVKFFGKSTPPHAPSGGEQKVFWQRADRDGLPFIGNHAPIMPDEEYEERVTRVAYPYNGFFDTHDPVENARFMEIVDAALNNWYQILHLERFWNKTTKHYIEWVVYYMQDGSRLSMTPFQQQNYPGLTHDQSQQVIYPQLTS